MQKHPKKFEKPATNRQLLPLNDHKILNFCPFDIKKNLERLWDLKYVIATYRLIIGQYRPKNANPNVQNFAQNRHFLDFLKFQIRPGGRFWPIIGRYVAGEMI